MPLNVIAIIDIKPEHTAAVERALHDMLAPSRAESGCLQYDLNRDLDHFARRVMIEQWADEAALARHMETPHMSALQHALEGKVERLEIYRLNQVI
jgi:quinol monooxygenase YgiN